MEMDVETIVLEFDDARAPAWSPLAEMRSAKDAKDVAAAIVDREFGKPAMRRQIRVLLTAVLHVGFERAESTRDLLGHLERDKLGDEEASVLFSYAMRAENDFDAAERELDELRVRAPIGHDLGIQESEVSRFRAELEKARELFDLADGGRLDVVIGCARSMLSDFFALEQGEEAGRDGWSVRAWLQLPPGDRPRITITAEAPELVGLFHRFVDLHLGVILVEREEVPS